MVVTVKIKEVQEHNRFMSTLLFMSPLPPPHPSPPPTPSSLPLLPSPFPVKKSQTVWSKSVMSERERERKTQQEQLLIS